MPQGAWEFDGDVTAAFDDMLERSIPQLDVMRTTVADLAASFLPPRGTVVELGCSNGAQLAAVLAAAPQTALAVGCDVSEPMLAAARARFADDHRVKIAHTDLRDGWPCAAPADVVLSVLTLQFTPIEHRHAILDRVARGLRDGGAFILVEKVLGPTARLDAAFTRLYHDRKREAGYTDEQIERKRLSLEGVLVPVTARWNEELLHSAGLRETDSFWRWGPFAGWLAVRG